VTHGGSTLLRLCDGEVVGSGMGLGDCLIWFDAVSLSWAALSLLVKVSKNLREILAGLPTKHVIEIAKTEGGTRANQARRSAASLCFQRLAEAVLTAATSKPAGEF
jgi:hypothetical protein